MGAAPERREGIIDWDLVPLGDLPVWLIAEKLGVGDWLVRRQIKKRGLKLCPRDKKITGAELAAIPWNSFRGKPARRCIRKPSASTATRGLRPAMRRLLLLLGEREDAANPINGAEQRTFESLERRGLLAWDGEGWRITEAGRREILRMTCQDEAMLPAGVAS